MIVAVNPNLRGIGVTLQNPFSCGEDFLLGGEDFGRFGAEGFGKVADLLLQQGEGLRKEARID